MSQPITKSKIFQQQLISSIKMVLQRLQDNHHITPPIHDQRLASQILTRALNMADIWTSTRDLLEAVGPVVTRSIHHEEWANQLRKALALSQQQEDIETEASLNFVLGRVQRDIYAEYEPAMDHYQKSEKLFAECDRVLEEAEAIAYQAYVARLLKEPSDAVGLVARAFEMAENGQAGVACRARAYGHFVLGVLAYDQLEWAKSESELQTSLTLWQALDDPYMEATGLSNLGPLLRKQEKYEEAVVCYETALERFEYFNDEFAQGRLYIGLGNVYLDMEQFPLALEMFYRAEPIIRQSKNPISLANCWANIGIAYREMARWQEAEEILEQAINQFVKYEQVESILDKKIDLALVFYYQNALAKAEFVKKEAFCYLEKIPDEQKREIIRRKQIKYLEEKIIRWQKKCSLQKLHF